MVSRLGVPARTDGPVRTCVGCRERAAKSELLRVVAGAGSSDQDAGDSTWYVVPDPRGTAPGRGAHLHPTADCFALAERRRAFARALRHDAGERGPLSLARLEQHLAQIDRTESEHPVKNGSTSS